MNNVLTLADRAEILKLADECADNKDGFSFAFYNTKEEIDALVAAIKKAQMMLA